MNDKRNIKGFIKAGYLYSLFPDTVRSFLLGRFNESESMGMNKGLNEIKALSLSQRIEILKEFVSRIGQLKSERARTIDNSLVASILVLFVLFLIALFYSGMVLRSTNRAFVLIDVFLQNGGMHCVLFPYLWGVVVAEYGKNPFVIIFSSRNHFIDILISIPCALIIASLFIVYTETGYTTHTIVRYFYFLVAVSVGPVIEEIFFRYFLFSKSGERFGFLPCWVISTLLFAAVHVPTTPGLFLAYCTSGTLFCALCYFRKSLFPAFCAHAFANCALLIV